MKTLLRMSAMLAVAALGLSAGPARAQVSVGVATPGFALGIGPGAGFVAGGYAAPVVPAYPVYAPPVVVPRPVFVPPPVVYGRPVYGGYYGRGPIYGGPVYGPRYAPRGYYRR